VVFDLSWNNGFYYGLSQEIEIIINTTLSVVCRRIKATIFRGALGGEGIIFDTIAIRAHPSLAL